MPVSLPLENESPAFQAVEDFSPNKVASSSLHHLLPSLGVSANPSSNTKASLSSSLGRSGVQDSPSQSVPIGGHRRTSSGSLLATSPPADSLRRQAVSSSANTTLRGSVGSDGPRFHDPSLLGRHYLATYDPQHISKHPQGSIAFPGNPHGSPQAVVPSLHHTSPALRNLAENESPTLSLASDEMLMLNEGIENKRYSTPLMFPAAGQAYNPTGRFQHARVGSSSTIAPHQIPLPPSPHVGGQPPSSPHTLLAKGGSPGMRAMGLGFGGTGGQLGSGMVPPSPSQGGDNMTTAGDHRSSPRITGPVDRHPMRMNTADSFVSTSSEEEDSADPMILPDTSLRPSDRKEPSPRSRPTPSTSSTSIGDSNNNNNSLFPTMSDVQRLNNMANSPFAFGAKSNPLAAATRPSDQNNKSSFTFQAGSDAPVFPPMSPSSSSSLDSDDESHMKGSGSVRFAGPVSPKRRVRYADEVIQQGSASGSGLEGGNPEDAGDYGHGYGGGKGQRPADDGKDGSRSGSITVGGRGYGDGSFFSTMGGNGRDGEDSSDDEDRPQRGGRADKMLENPSVRQTKERNHEERTSSRRKSKEAAQQSLAAQSEDESAAASTDEGADSDKDAASEESSEETGSDYDGDKGAGAAASGRSSRGRGRKRKAVRNKGTVSSEAKSETSASSKPDFMPSKAKRRKAGPIEEGDVRCDYVEPLPVSHEHPQPYACGRLKKKIKLQLTCMCDPQPYERCTSHFHRTYDLARHLETIHARNEGRAVEAGQLDEKDAKLWIEYGRPQCSWPCPVKGCGQIFSRCVVFI